MNTPLFGKVIHSRQHVQFLETMANLLGNGLTMVQAMQLTQQAIDNPFLRQEFESVMRNVGEAIPRTPMTPTELLVQSLLLSNEFVYVN